ncbi:MAG: N-acetylmuramic acid 6-phosphate etherase [Cyclobacteriaceae bacterium]|nr:N-acetylmuramic acid 6-phosphate etherase [Cyclobacteriaceae bacterium]
MNKKITESPSLYASLEQKSAAEILSEINREDAKIAAAVEACIPAISAFIEELVPLFEKGGRLFYIGAGTSGRLGILDASEIPPTYGMAHDRVIGIIAGGDSAIRKAVEFAEDDEDQAWEDLKAFNINSGDVLVGITASGTTPYVLGGIKMARKQGLLTAGISNNPNSPLSKIAHHAIEAIVGPEYVTGSTRMKAGTAQKLILNMISTALMVRIGKVKGNKMVNMQLSNNKLIDRGARMLTDELEVSYEEALKLMDTHGSVAKVIAAVKAKGS